MSLMEDLSPEERDRAELARQRQMETYSQADGAIWRHAVYDVLHGGWELASLGGREFLDDLVARSGIAAGARVLELGCGSGAACEYLARMTGCHVTGIDINPEQIERARRRVPASGAARYAFILADVLDPPALEPYDVVFQLDTFSLLPSMERAIGAARRLLRESGELYIADLLAGPHFDAVTRERSWQLDGFSSLIPVETLRVMLERNGFHSVQNTDQTEQAVAAVDRILAWLREPAGVRPEEIPNAMIEQWHGLMQWYRDRLAQRALGYAWWRASATPASRRFS